MKPEPVLPAGPIPPSSGPGTSGGSPDGASPLEGYGALLETLLRRPLDLLAAGGGPGGARLLAGLWVLALAGSLGYGLVVGSFSGGIQWWAAPVKVVVGLGLAGLICLPSLYVFACLSGARAGWREVALLLGGLLGLLSVLLVGFAPVAWVFSQSTTSIGAMGAMHLLFWLVAFAFGGRWVLRGAGRLGATGTGVLWVWLAILGLVMLQMMTALRPLVGTADSLLPTEKRFFLRHWAETLRREP